MDMKLTEEQLQLQEAAQRFMDENCTMDFVREMEKSDLGFSHEMWKQMAELGWFGIDLPETDGGLELGVLDLAILMKELGRHICPSPMIPTVVLAGNAIARAGSEEQREDLLPRIIDGELVIAVALQELSRKFHPGALQCEAKASNDHYVLNGTKFFVEYAEAADLLLVVARTSGDPPSTDGLTMFLVDAKAPGIETIRTPTMARDHHYEVRFQDVAVPRDRVLGTFDDAWTDLEPTLHRAALAFAAFTNGASFELHEQATEFARNRVQFGRPIGQLQSIQGYLAQLIMEILGSDMLTLFTAYNLDRGRPVRGYVAKAKAFSAETVARTMDIGSQIFRRHGVHGRAGFDALPAPGQAVRTDARRHGLLVRGGGGRGDRRRRTLFADLSVKQGPVESTRECTAALRTQMRNRETHRSVRSEKMESQTGSLLSLPASVSETQRSVTCTSISTRPWNSLDPRPKAPTMPSAGPSLARQRHSRTCDGFEVTNVRGNIEDGNVAHWQVTLKVGFTLDE